MRHCVEFADTLHSTRLEAAQRGERAWQREVAAEAEVESAPSIAARNAAGFAARATLADPTAPPRVGARPRVDRGR
jgi:hypothetical protein